MKYIVDTISLREFLEIVKEKDALPLLSLTTEEGLVFAIFFNNGKELADEICRICSKGMEKKNA